MPDEQCIADLKNMFGSLLEETKKQNLIIERIDKRLGQIEDKLDIQHQTIINWANADDKYHKRTWKIMENKTKTISSKTN